MPLGELLQALGLWQPGRQSVGPVHDGRSCWVCEDELGAKTLLIVRAGGADVDGAESAKTRDLAEG